MNTNDDRPLRPRTVVGFLAGPTLGPGDAELLDVLAQGAARGWVVRVAAPAGASAGATARHRLEWASVPDVEPWVASALGTAAARRRAERGSAEIRAAVAGADVIVTTSLDAVAALANDERVVLAVADSERAPRLAWLATEAVAGRRARDLLTRVAPALDLTLAPGEVATAAAEAVAVPVANVGDAQTGVVVADAVDALDHLANRDAAIPRAAARNVVFAVPDFEPTVGGTTRQTRNQAEALAARGGAVTIVTQRIEKSWPAWERTGAVSVRRLGPMQRSSTAMKSLVVRLAWWLRRKRDSVDVVQVIMYPDFVLSAWLAGMVDRTVMCWAGLGDATDVLAPTNRPARALVRAGRRHVMQRAAHIALTPALRDELTALGIDDVTVIPTPVDLDAFHPPSPEERAAARAELGVAPGELMVIYTGHLRALKRVDRLVDAFQMILDTGVDGRLFLVGDSRADLDDRRAALRAQVERMGLGSRVSFPGAVPNVLTYLQAADVFVLPSDREGLPNSLLEAMACGLACVAPPSAAGDQVMDASSGVIPPSNRPRDLADALLALSADPQWRARLGVGARDAAHTYGLEAVTDRYEALYRSHRRT